MERIYFDHAATTPVSREAFRVMEPYFCGMFGNANSQHAFGRDAEKAVANARKQVAAALNCSQSEIYFTSGGTESDNWAVIGTAYANINKGKHLITSKIEHAAVLSPFEQLHKRGFEVSFIDVDKDGIIDLDKLKKAIRPDTALISVMTANNEIGTIQPVKEIAAIAAERKIPCHTDAVQACGAVKLDVKDLGVSLLSISGHKIYGPKGIGVLYIKSGTKIDKLISGGHQERMYRGGTSNVPLIAGLGAAIEIADRDIAANAAYVSALRDRFIDRVLKEIPHVVLNGHRVKRLPNNVSFSFEFVEGESLLMSLDMKGIACSSGSACSSGTLDASHVILALGATHEIAQGTVRFSFGKDNTAAEVDYCADELKVILERLRAMSPLFAEAKTAKKFV